PVLTRYDVASLSDAVESADIDNDGDIDIVVNGEFDIASNDPLLKILKNNGNGTFAPAIDYTPSQNFADMKLRDINGDGFVDLVFAPDGNYPPYHFGTALNNGNGTFAPTVVTNVFSCGEGTIDAADLDHDGDLDIVLTEEETCQGGEAHIFIFRNDGNQNFVRMPDIALPGRLPHGLALAEVTGDSNIDIITVLSDGMGVFPGNGNLTFEAPIISTTAPFKFKMADFNGDGLLDVGMIMQQSSFGTDSIGTALGNGNGTFQAVRTQTGSSVFENLRISNDLEPGDVNGDGIPDLIVFNYASNDVSTFIGNPDGSLRPHQRYGIGNTPILGTLADFDSDGRIDVAASIGLPPSGLHNAIVLLRNVGDGPQPTPTPTPTATGTPPSPTPTATGTPPSPTPTPTATATASATPTATMTPTSTPTATATPTGTPSSTPTVTPTSTPRPTPTARPRTTPRPRPTAAPRP
ncbi:MAG TPA: VCBS repeat-containing protein, partial [Candidatus Udaeobacter sp.]|nr:VCBS repeat-containing protein [Candidatus Udaeobacter sp.]